MKFSRVYVMSVLLVERESVCEMTQNGPGKESGSDRKGTVGGCECRGWGKGVRSNQGQIADTRRDDSKGRYSEKPSMTSVISRRLGW